MSLKISLVTSKREHLLEIARAIARAIDDEFLSDAGKPVTVSMRGSYSCGKKIFPDTFREVLGANEKSGAHYSVDLYSRDEYGRTMFPRQIHKKGFFTPREAEFWSGIREGKPVEVQLMDAGYILEGQPPRFAAVKEWEAVKENFLKQRAEGGVTFISNDEKGATDASIDIWLQSKKSAVKIGAEKDRALSSPLRDAFNASSDAWSRYVELTINDERLLASPRFRALSKTCKIPRTATASTVRKPWRSGFSSA